MSNYLSPQKIKIMLVENEAKQIEFEKMLNIAEYHFRLGNLGFLSHVTYCEEQIEFLQKQRVILNTRLSHYKLFNSKICAGLTDIAFN